MTNILNKAFLTSLKEKYPEDTTVLELAGNDSFASLVYAVNENVKNILPIITRVPSEYGDTDYHSEYISNIREFAKKHNKVTNIEDPICIELDDIWTIVNDKMNNKLRNRYGFYTPCIGCHAHVHVIRIIIARLFNGKVITGERLKHDSKFKINQTKGTLEGFDELATIFNVKFVRYLEVLSDIEITTLLSLVELKHRIGPQCLYSGKFDNSPSLDISLFMNDYIIRVYSYIIQYIERDGFLSESELIDFINRECV